MIVSSNMKRKFAVVSDVCNVEFSTLLVFVTCTHALQRYDTVFIWQFSLHSEVIDATFPVWTSYHFVGRGDSVVEQICTLRCNLKL